MGRVLSLFRYLPGFRSPGHPIRKIIAGVFYGFVILSILSILFGPPSLTLASSQISSVSNSARISGHSTDKDSEILVIQNGETIAKTKPDSQTQDFYLDLSSLPFGTSKYELMACRKDNCSSRQTVTVTVSTVAGATSAPVSTNAPTSIPKDIIQITNVIDGDTVRLADGKVVRLIGMDTPEIGTKSDCFGQEAYKRVNELLQDQYVRLEKDVSETDRYNRLLRYIWKGDELINETLVAQGYARVSTYPPDIKYQDRFLAAERVARDANLGLWSACITPTSKPAAPKPTTKIYPTFAPIIQPTQPPAYNPPPSNSGSGSGAYTCDCSKTCPNLSCAEAQYQLNVCGCSARDADHDGTACDSQCQ